MKCSFDYQDNFQDGPITFFGEFDLKKNYMETE